MGIAEEREGVFHGGRGLKAHAVLLLLESHIFVLCSSQRPSCTNEAPPEYSQQA